ncbi:MAG: sigma-70 family RNA polymerase sigma factor [Hyphomicrobiaceae bacterium]|nr:sigma-70 family RNA polymerase sigma factor [Hyphomicrobiaceae bacterium]
MSTRNSADDRTGNFADAAFLQRLRQRDEAALHEVVQAYLPQIYRAARGAGLDKQNAEDAAQSTFLTFIEKIDSFEGRSHPRTWLFGILYRKIAETRRAVKRSQANEDIDEIMEQRFNDRGLWSQPPRGADGGIFDEDIRKFIEICLELLSEAQRMAFVLREVEEMPSEQICNTLAVSRTNLGVLLYRGRNRLRECLESHGLGD